MPKFTYKRDSVPSGETIRLEAQFKDSAQNHKDPAGFPTVAIIASNGMVARAATTSMVVRTAVGRYRLDYTIPTGLPDGVWFDQWSAVLDGYGLQANFDFAVDSSGNIEATGATITTPLMKVGDLPCTLWDQEEIRGINILMNLLRFRLRNTQILPDGRQCDVLSVNEMETYLQLALSELNITPQITTYQFSDPVVFSLAADLMVEGAYLRGLSALIPQQRGTEMVITDNGVSINPASISDAMSGIIGSLYTEYRAKMRSFKANHRPAAICLGTGNIGAGNPRIRAMRSLKERNIF